MDHLHKTSTFIFLFSDLFGFAFFFLCQSRLYFSGTVENVTCQCIGYFFTLKSASLDF